MKDVKVYQVKEIQHRHACKKGNRCRCPHKFIKKFRYEIRFRWPSHRLCLERRVIVAPDVELSLTTAKKIARDRYLEIVKGGEPPPSPLSPPPKVPTVAEFRDRYLAYKKNQRLKASTEYQRESILKKWIVPVLGHIQLDQVNLDAIDLLKEAMEELSKKYVNTTLAIVSNVLRVAVDLRVLREMPFRKVGLFKVDDSRVPEFYPVDDLGKLIAAGENNPRGMGIVLLGADAGLRSGEMRALGKDSISGDGDHLRIERQVWRDKMGTPKSGKGRVIPMTPRLRSSLQKLIQKDQEFVLRDDAGGILSPKRMRALVKDLQRSAGIKVTGNVHILRHTFCTHLAMRGVHPRVIQQLAGHRHLTTTERYMHVVPGAKEDAIAALDPTKKPSPKD